MGSEHLPSPPHLLYTTGHPTKSIQRRPSYQMQAYQAHSTLYLIMRPITNPLRRAPRRNLSLRRRIYPLKQNPSTAVLSVTISDPSRTNPTGRSMKENMTRNTYVCLRGQGKLHHTELNVRFAGS